jgi:PAS domain S-box-containing protein
MLSGFVLTLSLLIQFITAFTALRLIRVTGNRISWILISLAISAMAVRRSMSLFQFISGPNLYPLSFPFELAGLAASILMLGGVILIGPILREMIDENHRRKEAEKQLKKAKELSDALNSVSAVIHSSLDINTIMQQVIVEAAIALNADASSIGLIQDDEFIMKYGYNIHKDLIELRMKSAEVNCVRYAIEVKDVAFFNDAINDERLNLELIRRFGIRSMMVVPFIIRGTVVGAISFYFLSSPHDFTEIQIDFGRKLSFFLSSALENARLFQEHERIGEELRRSEALLNETQRLSKVGGWELDVFTGTLNWTEEVYRIYGVSKEIDPGDIPAAMSFYHPDSLPLLKEAFGRALEQGESYDLELEFINAQGEQLWVRTVGQPVSVNGKVIRISGNIMDITDRKRAEKERERLISELEVANRELEGFTYSVSHDLRAPVRHITGFAQLLKKRIWPMLDSTDRGYIETVTRSADKLGVMMDQLLDLSRLGRTELQKRTVDLKPIISTLIEELKEHTDSRSIQWAIGNLPEASGDPLLLQIVFANLLSNAVKFTRAKDDAKIEVAHIDEEDNNVFFIKDNGIGFNMKYSDELFEIFRRLHKEKEFEGSGVGLANVKRIIQRHGGRIWAEGKENEGAIFYVSLPKDQTK